MRKLSFVFGVMHCTVPCVFASAGARGKENARRSEMPEQSIHCRAAQGDGLSIFYREAGPKDAPPLLLHVCVAKIRICRVISQIRL